MLIIFIFFVGLCECDVRIKTLEKELKITSSNNIYNRIWCKTTATAAIHGFKER